MLSTTLITRRLFVAFALLCAVFTPAMAEAPTPAPSPTAVAPDPENMLVLDLSTGGRVTIQMFPNLAPAHVERIKTLARQGFYNGVIFHRVIDGFMAQTGDPTGTGTGGSPLPDLKAEFSTTPHLRGTVSMARAADNDSANSQFFICFMPRFALDNKYTVFGRVTSGMQYVDAIARGEPPETPDKIVKASIAADNVAPPAAVASPAAAPATQAPAITVDDLNSN
jgi:cyclophilin family peptidyl-prolyl cis-trans isomerase